LAFCWTTFSTSWIGSGEKESKLIFAVVISHFGKCTKVAMTWRILEPVSEVELDIMFKTKLILCRFGDDLFALTNFFSLAKNNAFQFREISLFVSGTEKG
jgi:hypothetical protein